MQGQVVVSLCDYVMIQFILPALPKQHGYHSTFGCPLLNIRKCSTHAFLPFFAFSRTFWTFGSQDVQKREKAFHAGVFRKVSKV